jgi:hypothetical protein
MIQMAIVVAWAAVLTGCGSAYSGLTNQSGLGAAQYRPAVVVEPGNEAKYEQVLSICRSAAANRQATAAQKAQLESITGVVAGAGTGAAGGLEFGSLLGTAGFDTNALEGAAIGAAAGAISGLASAFASGAEDTADETRRILLNCLRQTSKNGTLWQVVE